VSVLMTLRVHGRPDELERKAAENPDVLAGFSASAREHGVISHCFYGNDDGEMLIVDEWPSAEAFQAFFDANPEIGEMMASVGVTEAPEVKFWRKLETGDEM
jgi:heme-degrading monooxygenase HmoA